MLPETRTGLELKRQVLEPYIESLLQRPVKVLGLSALGQADWTDSIKGYGYGSPVAIEYLVDGKKKKAVLETVSAGAFGHEHMADRAQILLWNHKAFNRLDRHVQALDVGGFQRDGSLLSVSGIDEFFLLVDFVEGEDYSQDLTRMMQERGKAGEPDLARADALCDYLVKIHQVGSEEGGLYVRRIRELLGHGECIMGLCDSYPSPYAFITPELMEEIEHRCLRWRWKLKSYTHRLKQVHGDFHPWNILFQKGADFRVLDRSRGEWGEPADDVTCLTMNYLFFSLQRSCRLEEPFEALFRRFWERYLEKTGDIQILEVAAPFFAFRGLVMASPVWYPRLSEVVRRKLFTFILNILEDGAFDPGRVHCYYQD